MTEPKPLSEQIFDIILKPEEGSGSATFNLTTTVHELLGVLAYVSAMNPELNTPQKVRLYAEGMAKDLRELIISAQTAQRESGLAGALSFEELPAGLN